MDRKKIIWAHDILVAAMERVTAGMNAEECAELYDGLEEECAVRAVGARASAETGAGVAVAEGRSRG